MILNFFEKIKRTSIEPLNSKSFAICSVNSWSFSITIPKFWLPTNDEIKIKFNSIFREFSIFRKVPSEIFELSAKWFIWKDKFEISIVEIASR